MYCTCIYGHEKQVPLHLPSDVVGGKAQMLTVGLLYVLKHEWMIADLPQLHYGVHEGTRTTSTLWRGKSGQWEIRSISHTCS